MFDNKGILHFSATDLAGHLSCNHLTQLDAEVARGARTKLKSWEPLLEILRRRGDLHEQAYLDHLEGTGYEIVPIDGVGLEERHADETVAAMRSGAAIISQAALLDKRWGGRADILRRVDTPSGLGNWSYEVIDTKLARETKGASVLQLCLCTDLVAKVQGLVPEFMYVVAPWSGFEPQVFRSSDYLAFYRLVRRSLESAVADDADSQTYPDPRQHCEICRWQLDCDTRRRADDHLCLVAGTSGLQINELRRRDIGTMAALAAEPLPLPWKPERGAIQTYERIREQARVQVAAREGGTSVYEPLEPVAGYGLARLPEPSAGDVFFDLEGDPYVGEGGLEYLFGHVGFDDQGAAQYAARWAPTSEEEKRALHEPALMGRVLHSDALIVRLPMRDRGDEDCLAVSVVGPQRQHDDGGAVLGAFVPTLRRVALSEIGVADDESGLRIRNPRHAWPSTRDRIVRLRLAPRRG